MDTVFRQLAQGVAESEWPALRCPTCGRGSLSLAKEDVRMLQSGASARWQAEEGDPDQISGEFVFVLRCQAASCAEVVVAAGEMWVDYAKVDHYRGPQYEHYVRPCYFAPALPLIDLPADTPAAVADALGSAARVFWLDPGAAANKLRSGVDRILDYKSVRKTKDTKKGRERLTTHVRCLLLQKSDPDLGSMLLAVKWIGNEGSHSTPLTHGDVLDGARILRGAIRLLWDHENDELRRMVSKVNKRRGIS